MQLQEPIDNGRVLPEVAVGETGKIHFRPFVAICHIEFLAVRIEREQTCFRPYCLQAIKQFVQIGADAVFSRTQAFIDYRRSSLFFYVAEVGPADNRFIIRRRRAEPLIYAVTTGLLVADVQP